MTLLVDVQVVSYRLVSSSTSRQGGLLSTVHAFTEAVGLDQIGPDAAHFEYTIRIGVLEPEILSFEVSKRFSELAKLDLSLSSITKFLPYFPPRGAQRILTDTHAQERMKLLNTYFSIICKMEEVVNCQEFRSFFGLEQFWQRSPLLVGEIRPADTSTEGLDITALGVSEEFVFLGYGKAPSLTSKAIELVSSWIRPDSNTSNSIRGQLQVWYRFPNSQLYDRRSIYSLPAAITSLRVCGSQRTVFFGMADGRVGSFPFPLLNKEKESSVAFLGGMIHSSSVSAIELDESNLVWTGGEDGMLQQYSLDEKCVKSRILSNAESASITKICCGQGILFVGLSTGVVNIFDTQGLRLITLLQGPFSRIVGLELLNNSVLVAAHAGSMLDSVEGYNTVQFWDVSQVAIRGTSKLAHWGPSAAPIVGASVMNHSKEDMIAVSFANGGMNVFSHSRTQMTHRAKFIFSSSANFVRENCMTTFGDCMYVASDSVYIYKLPPHDPSAFSVIDVSSPFLCQAVSRTPPPQSVRTSTTSRQLSYQQGEDEDDLHSWARP